MEKKSATEQEPFNDYLVSSQEFRFVACELVVVKNFFSQNKSFSNRWRHIIFLCLSVVGTVCQSVEFPLYTSKDDCKNSAVDHYILVTGSNVKVTGAETCSANTFLFSCLLPHVTLYVLRVNNKLFKLFKLEINYWWQLPVLSHSRKKAKLQGPWYSDQFVLILLKIFKKPLPGI